MKENLNQFDKNTTWKSNGSFLWIVFDGFAHFDCIYSLILGYAANPIAVIVIAAGAANVNACLVREPAVPPREIYGGKRNLVAV